MGGLLLDLIVPPAKYRKMILHGIRSMAPVVKEIDSYNIPIFATNGNGDFEKTKIRKKTKRIKIGDYVSFEELVERSRWIRFIRSGVKNLSDEVQLVVYGTFSFPSEKSEKKFLKNIFSKADKRKKLIFLTHEPPYGKRIDKAKFGPAKGKHIGNRVITWAIKKFKPLLHISGHIH
jgi:Icc-related predicted phosphoesterase